MDLGIVFFQEKGKAALILLSLHDEYKIDVHGIGCSISQIIENFSDIRISPDNGVIFIIQYYLPDLTVGEVQKKLGGVGAEQNLILLGQPVQNLAGYLLKLRVEKQLRILHNDNARHPVLSLNICFQQGQHVDTPHTFSHMLHRIHLFAFAVISLHLNLKHLIDITAQFIEDIVISPVFMKIVIDASHKIAHI